MIMRMNNTKETNKKMRQWDRYESKIRRIATVNKSEENWRKKKNEKNYNDKQ